MSIRNLVVISDTHIGCKLALLPPTGAQLDEGGCYLPSDLQLTLWQYWREFWDKFVPSATEGEPYTVVMNGDCIDGVHHGSTSQWSHNMKDQRRVAIEVLSPIVAGAESYYHIRGTAAHVGQSAEDEEAVAEALGAIPNEDGQYSRYDLWIRVNKCLGHILHHVGATGSQAYEATAVYKEFIEEQIEAARWDTTAPDFIVRSHRHRHIMTIAPTGRGPGYSVVTPCWQGKTDFVWKIPGGRLSLPQWGGVVIRRAKGEQLQVLPFVKTPQRSKVEG